MTSWATPLSSVAEKSSAVRPSGGLAQDALHRLEEAEVAHVVGLVENVMVTFERSRRPCSMRSSRRPGVAMTMSVPRCSAPTCLNCGTPPKIGGGEQADRAGDGLHGAVDLHRELTRRGEDQGAGQAARLAVLGSVVLHQALDERGAEGDGLAGAGLAAAEHVLAGENVGDGRGLDRERARSAHRLRAGAAMLSPRPRSPNVTPSTSPAVVASASRRSSTTSSPERVAAVRLRSSALRVEVAAAVVAARGRSS